MSIVLPRGPFYWEDEEDPQEDEEDKIEEEEDNDKN